MSWLMRILEIQPRVWEKLEKKQNHSAQMDLMFKTPVIFCP